MPELEGIVWLLWDQGMGESVLIAVCSSRNMAEEMQAKDLESWKCSDHTPEYAISCVPVDKPYQELDDAEG